jgi:hypothetical protein
LCEGSNIDLSHRKLNMALTTLPCATALACEERNNYDATRNKAFISLSANPSTLKSVIDIAGRNKVDLISPNSLGSVLGFKKSISCMIQ